MTDLTPDQRPEGWSAGATGYLSGFAPHTAPYAADMAERLGVAAGDRVLDVAAGTGAFSLTAARRGAEVVATDFAPGMVEVLAGQLSSEGLPGRAEQADGQALSFADDSFDVGCSMFGLMFFPDRGAGLSELRRVVRPGGRVGIGTWELEGFTLQHAVRAALAEVLDGFTPPGPPVWAPLGVADGLRSALEQAGFVGVDVARVTRSWQFEDPAAFFRGFRGWSPPIQVMLQDVDEGVIDAAAAAFVGVVDRMSADTGGLPNTALLATGSVA